MPFQRVNNVLRYLDRYAVVKVFDGRPRAVHEHIIGCFLEVRGAKMAYQ